ETMLQHRKPAVGAKHAEAVRHVVQGRVELAGQRGLPEARRQGFDEDFVKAEIETFQAEEEQAQQHGKTDIVEIAMQRERERHRPARQKDMILNEAWAAVVSGGAAGGIADRHGDAEHMRDRIVTAETRY